MSQPFNLPKPEFSQKEHNNGCEHNQRHQYDDAHHHKSHHDGCELPDVIRVGQCARELKLFVDAVFDFLKCNPSVGRLLPVYTCILLEQIRCIEEFLTNRKFGLREIKEEVRDIEELLTSRRFGLKEIKNEIRLVKNEVILINNSVNSPVFGLNEIKNEIRLIENQVILINNSVNNPIIGLNEIKNEIRGIESQTVLLTNSVIGLNEIKNEVRGIENDVRALNRPLTCATDSVRICGQPVNGGAPLSIHTDNNGDISTIPSAASYSQIGRLYTASLYLSATSSLSRAYLSISNPGPRVLFLERIYGGLTDSSLLLLQRDIDFTGGTVQQPRNLNFAFPDESVMIVKSISDTDENVIGDFVGGWEAQNWDINYHGEIIVPPGHKLLITVYHGSGWLFAVWFEL